MKQQMDEARENVQQASRAMDEGRLSEAISEGTRAERQFEELKEDFRNQTSSQFDETVRDLRDQARELTQRQQELARQLAGESPDGEKNKKPSLKSERNREELQKGFAEQQDRLNRIVEQAKQTIEQAEQTEPLLSNKLYDTLRDLKDSKPEEALEATEFLTGRGMWAQSQEAEQAARRGIEQLQKGIEKAADSVLGSESESLRRAQTQLEEATRKLVGEVKSATGEDPTNQRRPGQRGQQNQDGDTSANSETGANGEASERDPNGQPADSEDTEPQPTRRPGQRGQQAGERQSDNDQKSSGSRGSPSASERAAAGRPGEQDEPGEQENSEQSESQSGDSAQENDDGQLKASSDQNQASQDQRGKDRQAQNQQGQQQGQRRPSSLMSGGREGNGGGNALNSARPLTGDDFSEWSDQLRDIEEMLEDPELRNRVAQVRDRARAMRAEFKRHGEMPQWDLVKSQLLGEMQSLQQRIDQEVSKLDSDRAMVPIDREPVPEEFDSLVQRYYELLGQERDNSSSKPR
jgi:hypothetical protein